MKKRRSSSGGRSGKSSPSRKTRPSRGKSTGGKKPLFSLGGGSKPFRVKKPFRKPSHDPGPKTGEGLREDLLGYRDQEEQPSGFQQALSSSGCGCCSSIAGLVWLVVMGTVAVVVILALRCGGC